MSEGQPSVQSQLVAQVPKHEIAQVLGLLACACTVPVPASAGAMGNESTRSASGSRRIFSHRYLSRGGDADAAAHWRRGCVDG